MNKQERLKKIESLGIPFQTAVKGIIPSNVSVAISRMTKNGFHEIDTGIHELDKLPTIKDGEWYSPAVFDGNNYRFIHLAPPHILQDDKENYFEANYHENYKPEEYDFNWGYRGQGLRQLIIAYRNAEKVWSDSEQTTGNIPLDRYLAHLRAINSLYPIEKTKPKQQSTIDDEEHGFQKLEDSSKPLRSIPNGIPSDLAECNRRFDKIISKTKDIKDAKTWVLLEEVFRAGRSAEKFLHPPLLNELARLNLSMDLSRRQAKKKVKWKLWVDHCLSDQPELTWNDVLDILERQKVLEYDKDKLKFKGHKVISLSYFKKIVSELRRKYKAK